MDHIPPAFSVHGILQATRILKWVAIPFSRGSSQPRDRTWVSHIAGRFFTIWVAREAVSFISWLIQIIVQWTWGCRFFFEVVILFPLDKCPELGLLDHMVSSIFNLLRNLHTVFFFFFKSERLYFFGLQKSLQMVTAAMKLKDVCSLEEELWPTQTAY